MKEISWKTHHLLIVMVAYGTVIIIIKNYVVIFVCDFFLIYTLIAFSDNPTSLSYISKTV